MTDGNSSLPEQWAEVVSELVHLSCGVAGDGFASMLDELVAPLGLRAEVLLVDLGQQVLTPLGPCEVGGPLEKHPSLSSPPGSQSPWEAAPGPAQEADGTPRTEVVSVEGTVEGRAFPYGEVGAGHDGTGGPGLGAA